MLRTLNALLAIQTSSTVNLCFYYAKKLPLLGKLLTGNLYAHRDVKKILAILVRIFMVLSGFATRFAYIGFMLYLPIVGLGETLSKEEQFQQFIHLLFMISFVVAGVSNAAVLEPKRSKYIAVKLMRMSPVRYMHTTLSYKYIMYFIYLLPAMLVFGSILGASFLQSTALALTAVMWRIVCEYGHLKLFERTSIVLVKQNALIWSVIGLGYAAAYIPIALKLTPITGTLLLSWPAAIIIIAAGLFGIIQLARYSDYTTAVDAATKRDDPLLDLSRMVTEASKTSVSSKESDYSSIDVHANPFQSKHGYAYLNAIFFARHLSLIKRPVNTRLAIIAAIGIIGILITVTFDQAAGYLKDHLGIVIPFLVPLMIYFSVGEKTCRALFYNCDLSLLRYSFYRRAAFQHFRIRLYKIIGQNMLIAAALGAAITLIYAVADGDLSSLDLRLLWICVLALSIFFSVHHLFMYYIFQPYATELNIKNPFFYIVSFIVSGVSGICLVLRFPSYPFTMVVFILTLIYSIAALILVRKYGSRTFRVK